MSMTRGTVGPTTAAQQRERDADMLADKHAALPLRPGGIFGPSTKHTRDRDRDRAPAAPAAFTGTCFTCGRQGHRAADCQVSPPPPPPPRGTTTGTPPTVTTRVPVSAKN